MRVETEPAWLASAASKKKASVYYEFSGKIR